MKPLTLSLIGGEHIHNACYKAIELAGDYNRPVRFRFNGFLIRANKRLSVSHLERQYDEMRSAQSRRYRNSAAGKKAAEKRAAEIVERQKQADWLIAAIGVSKDLPNAVRWMGAFAACADDIGVKCDKRAAAAKWEALGYEENWGCGHPPEWFSISERIGRYIVGQGINCMKSGLPPHGITHRFAKQYFAMAEAEEKV